MRTGLSRNKHHLIAALDVGSSKICCMVATNDSPERARVIGIGQQASRGVKSGVVVDMDAAETAIRSAVQDAEQMAAETIDSVVVNLSGGFPASSALGIELAIAGHEVGESDLRKILRQGRHSDNLNGALADGRQLIHSIPVGYTIDGSRGIRDPRGMCGDRLGVNVHIVTARSGAIQNLTTCIQRSHLDVEDFVVAPYASGLSSLVDDEMELGVTVIDMGGGTTTIAVFFEGNVIYTDLVQIGGQHVTNDVARGLSTPLVHAERMKTLYGHAVASAADERETIDVPQVGEDEEGTSHQVPRSLLAGIIQPRLEETFEMVRSRLEASGFDKVAGRRTVLTGGASQLPGLRDLAALVLDKQVRVGRPIRTLGLAEATSGPAYATCTGLLNYAISVERIPPEEAESERGEPNGLVGRLGHWFREHF
jgi:cell division protein FtsA